MDSVICLVLKIALAVVLVSKILQVFRIVVWRPHALTKSFKKQGVTGPPYFLLKGSLDEVKKWKKAAREIILDTNSNDIFKRVIPHYYIWSLKYGETFLFWHGTQPHLCISDPELAKQILSNKFGFYNKPCVNPFLQTLAGKGLLFMNGLDWVRRRRIVNPAFSLDKLKAMVKRMVACSLSMFEEWKHQAELAENNCIKIEINEEFQKLTADIIAHTAFGSSYVHGKEAFKAQRELQRWCAASNADVFIPGSQYLPTPSNLQIWKLDRKVKGSLSRIIESRLKSKITGGADFPYGDDLLGVMMAAIEPTQSNRNFKLQIDEILEECKTFFFAGHETTSNLLTWTMLLLSIHPEWQSKLKEEVLEECGMGIPDADILAKLKLMNMVLLEILRLYCPAIALVREASEDMKLGNLMIPKHTRLTIPIVKIHRSKEYWGEDANEFNPLRFKGGISKAAKHPNALMGFSVGPRTCIGQNFAMLEAKAVLALILQRFSFSLSPDYKHAPTDVLTLQPEHGLPIIIKPLNM
ncbi:cytochrome P450 709B2-like isoform X2 [Durio zibethinus]|uniref:Cytochrome P450 709B2-like isoform X2 n=1 Tax=Durio zibethinus TaxID=66656 RepID=A0A6P6AY16_DURZI|nr:cytochrome P450 709B2-like isoform X2 [Durio zibethinus]